jgi:hypothetical protein
MVAAARDAAFAFQHAYDNHGATAKVGEFIPMMTYLKNSNPEHIKFSNPSDYIGTKPVLHYFECCNRMVPFTASVKLAAEIYTRIYENYGDRARQAQSNEGVDWKALSHAVRVGHEALELLSTGKITLPLPIAPLLLDIKQGRLPYQEVSDQIEKLLEDVENAAAISPLSDEVDKGFIDDLVVEAYREEVETNA